MGEFVRLEVQDRVGTIRLDRPKMNALNLQMQAEMRDAANEASERDDIGAVVIYGGPRVFAAGADVKEMAGWDFAAAAKGAVTLHAAFDAVAAIRKPTIAAITGFALGGGCEVALCADIRFAADDATLGFPEILLGIIPGAGGTQRAARLIGPARAKDLIFTGRFVRAAEALAIGLVDQVHPSDEVYDKAVAYAARLASGPSLALRAAKDAVDRGLEVDLTSGLAIERAVFSALFATEDQSVGMTSFVENGPGKATFSGS